LNTVSPIIAHKPRKLFQTILALGVLVAGFNNSVFSQNRVMASTNSYYHGLSFSGTSLTVDSLQSEELLLEGVKEKILGNMTLAADYFNQSISADPKNDASLYELALINVNKKNFLEAKNFIQRALEVKPSEPFYLDVLLDVCSGLKDKEGMLSTFSRLIELQPSKPEYVMGKSEILLELGKPEEAIQVFNTYEKVSGDYNLAELQKEKIYLTNNNQEKALASIKVLLDRYPGNTRYYLLISEVYRSLGKPEISWDSLISAQKKSPLDGFIRLGFFEFYAGQGKTAQADSSLEKTFESGDISLDQELQIIDDYYLKQNLGSFTFAKKMIDALVQDNPSNKRALDIQNQLSLKMHSNQNEDRLFLGKYLEKENGDFKTWNKLISMDFQAGDMNALCIHTSRAIELYPNQTVLYWYLGVGEKNLKNYAKALEVLQAGMGMAFGAKEKEAILLQEMGEIYQAEGKYKLADSAFKESLKRESSPMVLNNFAYYLSLRGENLGMADSMAKKANQLETGNANYEDTYAWILYRENRNAEARIWEEKALKDDKNNGANFWDHYGDILYKDKEYEKSLDAWKKALRLGSKNVLLQKKIDNKHP